MKVCHTLATARMNLRNTMLRERGQRQKAPHCVTHLCNGCRAGDPQTGSGSAVARVARDGESLLVGVGFPFGDIKMFWN